MSNVPVVVSGVGTVSAHGVGLDALGAALAEGRPKLTTVERFAEAHLPGSARMALLATDQDLSRWVPMRIGRRMSALSRYAVAAARSAIDHAGLEIPDEPDPGMSTCLASSYGPSRFIQGLLDQIHTDGPEAMSPFMFTECVANAASSQVSIQCKASGPSVMICQKEAGPLMAVARGLAEVRSGRVRRALVGAVEEVTPLAHALLDRFRALARPRSGAVEQARPFDRRRNGFFAAEGATVAVLEAEEDARARGAQPLARLLAFGGGFDSTATRVGWGRDPGIMAIALRRCLDRCVISPGEIDVIVSGASGSRAGDRLEALTLKRVWDGLKMPPILVPKAVTGEYGGAFLGAAILATAGASFGRAVGAEEPDPELGVAPHDGTELPSARRFLVSSLASGGSAAWLVLERP